MLCSVYSSLLLILNSYKCLLLRLHLKRVYCTKTCGRKLLSNCLPSIFLDFWILVQFFTSRPGLEGFLKWWRIKGQLWPFDVPLCWACWRSVGPRFMACLQCSWRRPSWRFGCTGVGEGTASGKRKQWSWQSWRWSTWSFWHLADGSDGDVAMVFLGSSLEYLVKRECWENSHWIRCWELLWRCFFCVTVNVCSILFP